MLVSYLFRKSKSLESSKAFYQYLERFQKLLSEEMDVTQIIKFEKEYQSSSLFCEILGRKIIFIMNKNFEWHCFFMMLFMIEGSESNLCCLDDFLKQIESLYLNNELFEMLFQNLPSKNAQSIKEETTYFIAEALCELAEQGVQSVSFYKKGLQELRGFLQYTLNCTTDIEQWVIKKTEIQSIIKKSLLKSTM